MTDFTSEKALVRAFHDAIEAAEPKALADVMAPFVHPEWHWRGMHPFHEQRGPEAVARVFWAPLMHSLKHLQRRPGSARSARS